MNQYSFYDATSGLFTGLSVAGVSDAWIAVNTPPNTKAYAGRPDPTFEKVDIAATFMLQSLTPNVPVQPIIINFQPPAPAADALTTWAWDAAAKRWQAVPTQRAIDIASNTNVTAQLSALDVKSIRALIALTLNPASVTDKGSLQAVSDQIAALRLLLKVIV